MKYVDHKDTFKYKRISISIMNLSSSILFKGSHSATDQMYHITHSPESPSSHQPTPSHSNSLTSFGDVKFWKAGNQSQNTNRSYNHFYNNYYDSKGNKFIKFLKLLFKYLKWPLGLLLICGLLGVVVYILVLGESNV